MHTNDTVTSRHNLIGACTNGYPDSSIIFKTDKETDIKDGEVDSLKVLSKTNVEITVSYEKNKTNMEELINLVKKNNIKILDISTDDGDLEDVFLRLIKN